MKPHPFPTWKNINTIFFDFDGVFTDNSVYVNDKGVEFVKCNRGDGLAFDMLKKFKILNNWELEMQVLTREKNGAAIARAEKLQVLCKHGVVDKRLYIQQYLTVSGKDPAGLMFVGNDLNDLFAMLACGHSVAPQDAHPLVKNIATTVLPINGGDGFIRQLVEKLVGCDEMSLEQVYALVI